MNIDSKVLVMVESQEEESLYIQKKLKKEEQEVAPRRLSKVELAEQLRRTVATVRQVGKPGAQIQ